MMRTHSHAPVPFALPDIGQEEIDAVTEVLRSRWLTTGKRCQQFEAAFAEAVGADHAVALNSCTAALHLSLEAYRVREGDLVFMSPYTFAASAEVVRYLRATPVFVDIDPATLNIDVERLRTAVVASAEAGLGRPKAVMPVHLGGVPCDMPAIRTLAAEHGMHVIEDAAHAFPAARDGAAVGGLREGEPGTACFSFYATKTITTGEGGMLTTGDAEIAARARMMSLHGLSRQAWTRYEDGGSWVYDIVAPGFKYNLTDLAAALGLVQLQRAEQMRLRREAIAARYSSAFADLPGLAVPTVPAGVTSAWHLYVLRVGDGRSSRPRDELAANLTRSGIGCSVHFIPLHLHSYYAETYGYRPGDFPLALRESQRSVSLPLASSLTDDQVGSVIAAVRSSVTESARHG
jgi:perosamine synthetase